MSRTAPGTQRPRRAGSSLLQQAATATLLPAVLVGLEDLTAAWPDPARHDGDIAEALAACPLDGPGLSQVLDVLPILLQRIEAGEAPKSTGTVLHLLMLSEEYSAATLSALSHALRLFLAAAPDPGTYREALGALADMSARLVQARTADAVLDLVDLIAAGPEIDPAARITGCQEFLTRLRAFAGRLDAAQLVLATTLSDELHTGIAWPTSSSAGPHASERRERITATVLLYSLQDHVLGRVNTALDRLFPQVTVHLSRDLQAIVASVTRREPVTS